MPSQLYATDRNGLVYVIDPTTLALAGSPWSQATYQTAPGPALFGFGLDPDTEFLYTIGLPNGLGSNFYALTPTLEGSDYVLTPPAPAADMDPNSFQPDAIAIDSDNSRVFVADSRRFLSVWNTDITDDGIFEEDSSSPYYPNSGVIRALGVAYNPTANQVYTCCQSPNGQDQLAVYDASMDPMTQISGSPFNLTLSLSTSNSSIAYDSVNNHILITTSLGLVVLNASTFAPITGSPFSTGGSDPRALTLDSTNGLVYVCNFGNNTLAALHASTLAPISGSPYATGYGPKSVAYFPTLNRVYVANFNGNPGGVTVFTASSSSLSVISGSPFLTTYNFSSLAVGP